MFKKLKSSLPTIILQYDIPGTGNCSIIQIPETTLTSNLPVSQPTYRKQMQFTLNLTEIKLFTSVP